MWETQEKKLPLDKNGYMFSVFFSSTTPNFCNSFMNVFIYSFISLIFWGSSPYCVPVQDTVLSATDGLNLQDLCCFQSLLIIVIELFVILYKYFATLCLYAFGHTDPSVLNVLSYLDHLMNFSLSLRLNCVVSRYLASFISETLCEFHYFNNTVAYI